MEELRLNGESTTVSEEETEGVIKNDPKQGLVVIVGGCNSVNATTVIQINGDTLSAIAASLKDLPPETVDQITGPLGEVLKAAGLAITKAKL